MLNLVAVVSKRGLGKLRNVWSRRVKEPHGISLYIQPIQSPSHLHELLMLIIFLAIHESRIIRDNLYRFRVSVLFFQINNTCNISILDTYLLILHCLPSPVGIRYCMPYSYEWTVEIYGESYRTSCSREVLELMITARWLPLIITITI